VLFERNLINFRDILQFMSACKMVTKEKKPYLANELV
jgi:hypothetical protein